MTNNDRLLAQLPQECQHIKIEPRHKVALKHVLLTDNTVWVVLLTTMPGDSPKAWHMPRREYWGIQPKHENRDRWIRENVPPTIETDRNPPKARTPQLLLF